jgi:hypothetical protein
MKEILEIFSTEKRKPFEDAELYFFNTADVITTSQSNSDALTSSGTSGAYENSGDYDVWGKDH